MKTQSPAAKTVARKTAAKLAPIGKVRSDASTGPARRYQIYDTTVEPQHTTRERIAQAVALALSR